MSRKLGSMDNNIGEGSSSSIVSSEGRAINQADVPFLVTHWLANYHQGESKDDNEDPERKEAMQKIRKATSEIASAFCALGAFGTTFRVSDSDMN